MFRVVFAVLPRHRPRFFSSLSRRIRCAIWCIKNSSSLSCPVVPVWREVTSRKLYPVSTDDRTYANFSLEVFLFSSPSSGVHSTHSCGWRFVVLLPLLSIYFSCFFFVHLISSHRVFVGLVFVVKWSASLSSSVPSLSGAHCCDSAAPVAANVLNVVVLGGTFNKLKIALLAAASVHMDP